MSKVTAGVLAGVLLGAIYGVVNAGAETSAGALTANLLGRASQGIINGVLAAYANKGATPLWRGALWGALIGAGLGAVSGLAGQPLSRAIPLSALVGLGCGIATARAKS
jgi:hypothetical protein